MKFRSRPPKAKKGQDVSLPCVVKAFPVPRKAWKKDGVLVTNDSRHVITDTELRIKQVGRSDMGEYSCIAWNRGSVKSARALLLITGKVLSKISPPPWGWGVGAPIPLFAEAH